MRQRRAEAETAARFYMVGLLAGIITLLLSGIYSLGLFRSEDAVEQLNNAIRMVDRARTVKLLDQLLSNDTYLGKEKHRSPLYALTCVGEEETEEAQLMIQEVARRCQGVPVDVDYAHHPLTAAYRHHRYFVAQTLLKTWRHPVQNSGRDEPVMDEVYAAALTRADLQRIDPEVYVYCRPEDAARCRVVDAARIRGTATSRLEAAYRKRYGIAQEFPREVPYRDQDIPPRIVAPGSTIRAGYWDNPFRSVLPGLLPPRTAPVINPAYFHDILDQLLYTLFGHVEGSNTLQMLLLFSMGTMIVFLAAWCIGMTYALVYYM